MENRTIIPQNKIMQNYYNPITGQNYGDTIPEGMVRVRRFEDLTPQAQDEYMANRPIQLNEVVIYPRSGKGPQSILSLKCQYLKV